MGRAAIATIDLDALKDNCRHARYLAAGARAAAIIKANGYGHGAVRVAQALSPETDAFGVACIEEAAELRAAEIDKPIVLLEGFYTADELEQIDRSNLTTAIHHREQLEQFLRARPTRPIDVWLKMDSGMHRIGFAPEDFANTWARLKDCAHVGRIVLMTHFARADELDCEATTEQIAVFERNTNGITAPRSLANSAATLAWPRSRGEWIRPGIMLYGASPLDRATPAGDALKPVMSVKSALISIRDLSPGEAIGYGARFVCERPTRVGVVAFGYGDGYPRSAPDGTPVAVNGRRTRLIGRVSMDMLTIDLSKLPDARVGNEVELWGEIVTANEVARASGTIAYELFTGITRRVPLVYQGAAG